MKYIITILVIICAAISFTLYFVWPEKSVDIDNVAVTVNGHNLAKNIVEGGDGKRGYHSEDYNSLLDSAITRELLIQEAQRQGIDKQENFRISLKTFYEESLIKTLMDVQYTKPTMVATDAEVDNYLSFYGKVITFTRLAVIGNTIELRAEVPPNAVLFDDLAETMKIILSSLKPGEHVVKFDTGSGKYAIRLESIGQAGGKQTILPDRERVKVMLDEYKQQQQIESWLNELRKKASITIHNG
ncbi:MAG: hypothetical protein COA36_12545 [Desulfotalea sp.]|nr:MAG: hypothetical protein COA36_12545 [Desulfotalea sp.]